MLAHSFASLCLKQRGLKHSIRSASRALSSGVPLRRDTSALPSPRGLPVIGTTLSLIAAGSAPKLHEYVDARHRQLGPVYQEKIGHLHAVFVADPNEMRRVFALEGKHPSHLLPEAWVLYNEIYGCKRGIFFMEGEEWLKYRRIMNDLLMRADSSKYLLGPCDLAAADLASRWGALGGPEVPHLEAEMYKWATNVMMAVLMGPAYKLHQKRLSATIDEFANGCHQIMEKSVTLSLMPAKLAVSLRLPAWKAFVQVVNFSLDSVNNLVRTILPECKESDGLLGRMKAGGMQEELILRIVADLILAAGDTSAFALQWILYKLAENPAIQEELFMQLKDIDNPNDIMQSTLLKNCVREVLRLYPVAPFILRYLPQDSIIGGYPVPSGQLIILSLYTSGRDARNFPEPSRFWPARWARDVSGNYAGVGSPYASLPFAMGARSCIGRKIADAELMITTARLLKSFKIELIDKVPVNMVLRLVSVPSKPIRLWLTKR